MVWFVGLWRMILGINLFPCSWLGLFQKMRDRKKKMYKLFMPASLLIGYIYNLRVHHWYLHVLHVLKTVCNRSILTRTFLLEFCNYSLLLIFRKSHEHETRFLTWTWKQYKPFYKKEKKMKTICASLSNMNIDSKKMLWKSDNPKTISKNNLFYGSTSDLRFDGVFFPKQSFILFL